MTVITLLTVLFLTSCRNTKTIVETETVYIEKCVVDTVIRVEEDSASLRALFECDSLGNVLINELATLQGDRVSVAPQIRYITVKDEDGTVRRSAYMSVIALADSLQQHISILEDKQKVERKSDKKEDTPYSPIKAFLWGLLVGFLLSLSTYLYFKL